MTSPIYTKVAPSYPGKGEGPLAVALDRILSPNGPIVGTIIFGNVPSCLAPTEAEVPLGTSTVYVTAPLTNLGVTWLGASSTLVQDAYDTTASAIRQCYMLEAGQTIPILVDDLRKIFAMSDPNNKITYSGG